MKPLAQLDQLNLDADIRQQVTGIVQTLLDQAQQEIRAQELKIQALTMELAHLRRIRFDKKNESLSSIQPSLFEESVLTDIAAIHAEIEQIDTTAKTATAKSTRSHAGRQPLPDHLTRIEHRHEPASCQCGQCGNTLVKIGEDVTEQLDVLNRPGSLSIVTSGRSMRARPAKPSLQSRCHRQSSTAAWPHRVCWPG